MSELRIVADLMALAARTAPKSVGKDFVVIRIIEGNDVRVLAEKMLEFGQQTGKVNFDRDGKNVAASDWGFRFQQRGRASTLTDRRVAGCFSS
jgi:uncharacterized ferredoxin-like protein